MHKRYRWQGWCRNGRQVSGITDALDKKQLIQQLDQQQICATFIKRNVTITWQRQQLTYKQIIYFTRQLANLTTAGLTVNQAINTLANNPCHTLLSQLAQKIAIRLTQGSSLSQALEHCHCFTSHYCQLIAIGEQTGTLAVTLTQLAIYQEKNLQLKQKTNKALYYPLTVASIAIVITVGLLIFVVPQFKQVFATAQVTLPPFTRLVLALADHLVVILISFALSLAGIALICREILKRSPHIRLKLALWQFKLPVLGPWLKATAIAKWSQVMATTLTAGIPLLPALTHAKQSITNCYFKQVMEQAITRIIAGSRLATALANDAVFSNQLIALLSAGEQSGILPKTLDKIAELEQNEVDQQLAQLMQLIEPVTLILLATCTGSIIIALYLPIFQLGSLM